MGAVVDSVENVSLSSSTSSSKPPAPQPKEESRHTARTVTAPSISVPSLVSPSSAQRVPPQPMDPSPTSSFNPSTTPADLSRFGHPRQSDLRSSTSSNPSSSTGRPFDPSFTTFHLDPTRSMALSSFSAPSLTPTSMSMGQSQVQQQPPVLPGGTMRGIPVSAVLPPTNIPGMNASGGQSRGFPDAGMSFLQQYPAIGERVLPGALSQPSGIADGATEMEFRGSSRRNEYVQPPPELPPPSAAFAGGYRDVSEFGMNVSPFGGNMPRHMGMSQPQEHVVQEQYGFPQDRGSNQHQPAFGEMFDGNVSLAQPGTGYSGYGSSALRADDDVPLHPHQSNREQHDRMFYSNSRRGRR